MAAHSTFAGTCHCGAIRGTLAATKPAAELQVRSCQCGFCTRHGAMTVSDPGGRATFEIDRSALAKYQFGTRTGTSLICARCGMYAGVILEDCRYAAEVTSRRIIALMSQPVRTNSVASQSSRAGCVGAAPVRPKLSTVATRPSP